MDYLKELVEPREQEMHELWTRYDEDRGLYDLDTYVMYQLDGQEMPNVLPVTLPGPQTFVDKVISVISSAVSQIVIEGDKLREKQPAIIENCLTDIFAAADERISNLEYPSATSFNAAQFCLRGKGAMGIALKSEGEEIVPDILPLDPHFFSYDFDKKGLTWGCSNWLRSKAKILASYPQTPFDDKDVDAEVKDFWNNKENVLYVKGAIISQENNPYGYPPFVTQICNVGSFLMDKESMIRHGESLFAPLRKMYPEINRLATILATQSLSAIKPALQKQVENEALATPPALDRVPGVAKIVAVTKGYEYLPMPTADMNRALQQWWSILSSYVQQASLSMTEYGNLTFPLSAIALKGLAAKNDTVYLPRIQAMAMLYQKAARMIIKQLIAIGKPINLSVSGLRKTYQVSDLEGTYKIGFKFFAISPEEEIANYSLAAAAKAIGFSQDTIFRSVIKLQDPEGEIRKRASEDAEMLDPAIKLYRQCYRLVDAEDYVEAELTLQSLERLLRQRALPPMPLPPPNPEIRPPKADGFKAGEELLPLISPSGRRARVPAEQLPEGEEAYAS